MTDATRSETTVQLAAAGDEAAFARLVSDHHASMARVAFVVAGDADVAQDSLQAAWLIAWKRLRTLRDPSRIRAWLVSIAANEARQAIRRSRRHAVTDISVALDERGDGDPADDIAGLDLARALRRLGADDRMLLAMRYVAGLDSAEIAVETGISASGVRSRLARLLDRMRMDLDHE